MIDHETAMLLAAGAALDDLAPDEQAAYDAHRAGCHACARVAAELEEVVADLALLTAGRTPPPRLLADIRRAIAGAP